MLLRQIDDRGLEGHTAEDKHFGVDVEEWRKTTWRPEEPPPPCEVAVEDVEQEPPAHEDEGILRIIPEEQVQRLQGVYPSPVNASGITAKSVAAELKTLCRSLKREGLASVHAKFVANATLVSAAAEPRAKN